MLEKVDIFVTRIWRLVSREAENTLFYLLDGIFLNLSRINECLHVCLFAKIGQHKGSYLWAIYVFNATLWINQIRVLFI